MINVFVKIYVYRKLRNKKSLSEINNILSSELKKYNRCGKKVKYGWLWSAGVHVPNASATIPGLILINAEWAYRIVIDNDNCDMRNAFNMTIYHELTHQENDFFFPEICTPNSKFVNWINEVHADFGGVKKAFNGKRSVVKDAIDYKISCKKKKDKDTRSHPSWSRRLNYLLTYNFDEQLIDVIASDVECTNDILISAVKKHFARIILGDG